jgi:peptidoglycan/xylan/chitin deacetylase (PgdA/CDA1 family)
VYLTFDDGPEPGTDDVIDVCKTQSVAASFMMVGAHMYSDWRKAQVKAANDAGFLVGNHSYSHWHQASNYDPPAQGGKTDAEWIADFHNCDNAINAILGTSGKRIYARLPGKNAWRLPSITKDDGNSKRVADAIRSDGYSIFGWDVEFTDTDTAGAAVSKVEAAVANGRITKAAKVIVLSHDRYFRASQGNKQKLIDFIVGLKNSSNYTFEFGSLTGY